MGDLNSANRYVYAGDDPVNVVDPSGKASLAGELVACVIGGLSDVFLLLKPILAAYLTAFFDALLTSAAFSAPEVVFPTLGAILATFIVGCLFGAALYGLVSSFPSGL